MIFANYPTPEEEKEAIEAFPDIAEDTLITEGYSKYPVLWNLHRDKRGDPDAETMNQFAGTRICGRDWYRSASSCRVILLRLKKLGKL